MTNTNTHSIGVFVFFFSMGYGVKRNRTQVSHTQKHSLSMYECRLSRITHTPLCYNERFVCIPRPCPPNRRKNQNLGLRSSRHWLDWAMRFLIIVSRMWCVYLTGRLRYTNDKVQCFFFYTKTNVVFRCGFYIGLDRFTWIWAGYNARREWKSRHCACTAHTWPYPPGPMQCEHYWLFKLRCIIWMEHF